MQDRRISIERKVVPISSLVYDEDNLNTHGPDNLDSVVGSLDEWGQIGDLVVQKRTGKVINGNLRLQQMAQLGFDSVAITEVDCTDEESIAIAIALNESQRHSEFDIKRMSDAVEKLMASGFSIESMGLVESRMEELISSIEKDVEHGIESIKSGPSQDIMEFSGDGKNIDSTSREEKERLYPLAITLGRSHLDDWTKKKREIGINSDTAAFIKIVLDS